MWIRTQSFIQKTDRCDYILSEIRLILGFNRLSYNLRARGSGKDERGRVWSEFSDVDFLGYGRNGGRNRPAGRWHARVRVRFYRFHSAIPDPVPNTGFSVWSWRHSYTGTLRIWYLKRMYHFEVLASADLQLWSLRKIPKFVCQPAECVATSLHMTVSVTCHCFDFCKHGYITCCHGYRMRVKWT